MEVKIFDGSSALKSVYQYRDWVYKYYKSIEIISVNVTQSDTVFVTYKLK